MKITEFSTSISNFNVKNEFPFSRFYPIFRIIYFNIDDIPSTTAPHLLLPYLFWKNHHHHHRKWVMHLKCYADWKQWEIVRYNPILIYLKYKNKSSYFDQKALVRTYSRSSESLCVYIKNYFCKIAKEVCTDRGQG